MDVGSLLGVLLLGLVAGAIARALVPGDAFRHMSGPRSWLLSIAMGLLGSLLGYWFFRLIGIGDTDKFDWGGILGAILGAIVVVAIASMVFRRTARKDGTPPAVESAATPPAASPATPPAAPPAAAPPATPPAGPPAPPPAGPPAV